MPASFPVGSVVHVGALWSFPHFSPQSVWMEANPLAGFPRKNLAGQEGEASQISCPAHFLLWWLCCVSSHTSRLYLNKTPCVISVTQVLFLSKHKQVEQKKITINQNLSPKQCSPQQVPLNHPSWIVAWRSICRGHAGVRSQNDELLLSEFMVTVSSNSCSAAHF